MLHRRNPSLNTRWEGPLWHVDCAVVVGEVELALHPVDTVLVVEGCQFGIVRHAELEPGYTCEVDGDSG